MSSYFPAKHPWLCEDDIIKKVREQKVFLEPPDFSKEKNAVVGTVRVANLALEKSVQVCYTLNHWKSKAYLNLIWKGSVREVDKFFLVIPLPKGFSGRVTFAIRYGVNGREYWDNNDGDDYHVNVNCDSDAFKRLPTQPVHYTKGKSGDENNDVISQKVMEVKKQKVIVLQFQFSKPDNAVIGSVLVANLAFKKRVQVCYTLNGWKDHKDLDLIWGGSVGELDEMDIFSMFIPLLNVGHVEFAIRYEVNGMIFWDSNNLKYYKLS